MTTSGWSVATLFFSKGSSVKLNSQVLPRVYVELSNVHGKLSQPTSAGGTGSFPADGLGTHPFGHHGGEVAAVTGIVVSVWLTLSRVVHR